MIPVIIAAAGLAMSAYGMAKQQSAASKSKAAINEVTALSAQAESLRAQQMTLETQRNQREVIRQMMIASSLGVSNAANSGAMNSTGLAGGLGQIAGLAGQKLVAGQENLAIGQQLFSLNAQKASAEARLGISRSDSASSQGLFSLGMSVMQNSKSIGNNLQTGYTQVSNAFNGS